jgi:hypothetical protein
LDVFVQYSIAQKQKIKQKKVNKKDGDFANGASP